ncbi:cleavage stimulating factor 64 [Heracleum sosnowskyi]|uniref:Cleavage stimulating factor 64 n=1 Tax=Heracleum sosnowskyi TaxID=360622 RepID=A0AAD8JH23_9APIA|nr:cleavage stimulating factor 64 [Heracleum sosnowskyi]
MAETQLAGVELSENIAGMSKNQLYHIMSQMKALIEQNQKQARHILVTNPPLTRALFQAQIMLGMVQPAEAIPSIPQTTSQNSQQSNVQATSTIDGQVGVQDQRSATEAPDPPNKQQEKQTMMPVPSPSIASLGVQSYPQPSLPAQLWQQPMEHVSAEATAISLPQPPQVHNVRPTIHSATNQSPTQSQQPLHTSGTSHMQLQPPPPPQQRSPFLPAFGHQTHSQMGPNEGLQHSGAPQMHHARPMFHSGYQHPVTVGPLFSQGHPTPTHQPTPYQGGSPHMRMEINQVQADRGFAWSTGLRDATGTQLLPGRPQYGGGQIGPGSYLHSPQLLSPDMETALLQQVMSLTPEQINLLPADQRNQVLQLQMMLRQ